MNIQTILVPSDFSENSMAGIDYARDLARKFEAKIVLCHVSPSAERLVLYGPPPAHLPKDLEDAVIEGVEQGLKEVKGRFDTSDDLTTVHLRGEPAAELVNHASKNDVDLIVMSTHGRTGLGHLVLGSVAERVVRTSTCPVLTVKPTTAKIKLKKILLATDFSENAAYAIPYAHDLALTFGAQIDLAHVHQPPVYTGAFVYGTIDVPANYTDEIRKALWARLEEKREKLGADVEVRPVFLEGVPFKELIRHAADNGVDLIIMSTHGHTGLKHVLLGSTAERVVREASCPVMTVRPVDSR